jgi:hypothetical protein
VSVFVSPTMPEVAMSAEPSWAVLRHLVLAATDALAASARLAAALRLPAGFGDPELAAVGLTDRNMPVGGQKYLEVVGPLGPDSYINRWLGRVGGQGGYCLSVQVPDVAACKERARERNVRLAADQQVLGHPIVQLHPADVGVLLELDGISDQRRWFWDDITPGPRPDALIDDITAVTVGVPDPEATAALWAAIIGLELAAPARLDFSGCAVGFVAHPRGQVLAATFRRARPGDGGTLPGSLLGVRASYTGPGLTDPPAVTLLVVA